MLILVIFSAGVVWAYTGREFVEVQTFEVHVEAEQRQMDQKFKDQKELIDTKFKYTDKNIEDLDKDIERTQQTLEEIKDLIE
jgi:uncharacterized protein HemX